MDPQQETVQDGIPAAYRRPPEEEDNTTGGGRSRDNTGGNGQRRVMDYPPAPEPLGQPVIDNHTHLDFRDGSVEVSVNDALDAAEAVGVKGAVQVGCDLQSSRFTIEALEVEPRLLGAVAIHPNEAPLMAADGTLETALEEIERMAAHSRVRCIGETGLDYFRTAGDGIGEQQYSFRRHIDMAKRLGLALQIHDRDAHDDVVRILREEGAPEHVVFHCFSGGAELARICKEEGWYVSFAGTVTFKNAANLRAALAEADPDRMMVETDAPFLTPHPYRGRPNASYMIPYTVRSMAEELQVEANDLAARLTAATQEVYGPWPEV